MILQPPPAPRDGEPPGAVVLIVIFGAIVGALVGPIVGGSTESPFLTSWQIFDDVTFGAIVGGVASWLLVSIGGEVRRNVRARRAQRD
jgi:MFS family permease